MPGAMILSGQLTAVAACLRAFAEEAGGCVELFKVQGLSVAPSG